MRFSIPTALLLAALATGAAAQSDQRPHIIVAISVDQFSADLFAEYRPLFTSGLRRLQDGVVFPDGYQSHAATETCPGHSTILTGSRPARTGIIANEWYDQSLSRADKKVYCTEDPSQPGSSSTNITVSAQFLKAPTLGDRMKAADARSRVVSVAGKDRAALMMGGHAIDQAWFWSGKSFTTLKGTNTPIPAVVEEVNAAVAVAIQKPARPELPKQCRPHSAPVRVADKTVGVLQERKSGDFQGFRTSLAFDRAITDIAI
jgi:alkaline phosphatase